MIYILYNPVSGDRHTKEKTEILQLIKNYDAESINLTELDKLDDLLLPMTEDDTIILCGGDGTINRFVNNTKNIDIKADILYYPAGTGNDFARDISNENTDAPFSIKHFLKDLPTVEVKGKTYHFLNNVGFGIDGYCCERGDIEKAKSDKPVNYTSIAIKGLLFHFKPRNAIITIDGVTTKYRRVWLAPTMKGRFYGGGMMATPNQDRNSPDKSLSIMLYHNAGKIRALMIFPKIFSGEHIKYSKIVTVKSGHEISVTFDRPTPLQIDGETILDVTTYTAKA